MLTQRLTYLGAIAMTAGLLGCGGGGGGGDDDESSGSGAFTAAIKQGCQQAFDCMASYDATMHNGTTFAATYSTSVDACVTQIMGEITAADGSDYLAKIDASIAAGRITYDEANARDCLDAELAETCDQVFAQNGATFDPPPSCTLTFAGNVLNGQSCTVGLDCGQESAICDTTMVCCDGSQGACN